MTSDSAAGSAVSAARGVRYLPGRAVAVIAPDAVLLIPHGREDVARLLDEVSHAQDARGVLVAAAGGSVLDLDALPDLALAHRGPTGLRVLLSGWARCTVVDQGTTTELNGADVALLGEWGFSASATVELAVHGAAAAEPGWPVSEGVVPADRVRWAPGAGEACSSSSPSPSSSPAAPERTAAPAPSPATEPSPASDPAPEPAPAPATPGTDATLPPEETAAPASPEATLTPPPALTPPTPPAAPASSLAQTESWGDAEFDDVEYTSGGGIDYGRVLTPARPAEPTPAPAPAPVPAPDSAFAPAPAPAPAPTPTPVPAPPPEPDPTPAPPLAAPDLAGDTVPPGVVAALRDGEPGAGPDQSATPATAAETVARLCPQNHANPPQLTACRICAAPLDGPTVRVTRPSLGVVRLSTGMFFDLDRPLMLGRQPRIDGVEADAAPRLIVLPGTDKAISRSHLRVDIDGWSVHAVDLGSVNGTYLRRGAADDVRLMPHEPKMLMSGDILVVDDVKIRFEDLP